MNVSLICLGGALICFAWLISYMDFSDDMVPGSYDFSAGGVRSHLVMRPDHRFHQEVLRAEQAREDANGSWRRIGEGGISFSKEFIVLPGTEEYADQQAFGEMEKALGLFLSIRMADGVVIPCFRAEESKEPLVGVYLCKDEPNVVLQLIIKADHTFTETVETKSSTIHAVGTWDNKNGIEFSRQFLTLRGIPLAPGETASDDSPSVGQFQIDIRQHSPTGQASFRKRYFPVRLGPQSWH